jgi:NitT/TauT family transport system ATP-binding protein
MEDRRGLAARSVPSRRPAVEVVITGVTKDFVRRGAALAAVNDLDLAVAPGEFVSVIGPSGSGKSTILRLIAGLLEPDAGNITVGGRSPGQARLDKTFGFVPQTPALLPWRTVAENITTLADVKPAASGQRGDPESIANLMTSVGLTSSAGLLPVQLSGGMQQRVNLVRAFALGAPVLLMDEPFAALDEITRSDMRYLLLDLWHESRPTVLFVTHSIPEAVVMADRVVVLSASGAQILADECIRLPRPRFEEMEDSELFLRHVQRVRSSLRAGRRE